MKKKMILAWLAVLLALGLGIVSCDDGSDPDRKAAVPVELTGYYTAGNITMEILGTGRGKINDDACTFIASSGVLTVKMGDQSITANYAVNGGAVTFSNVQGGAGTLKTAFDAIAAASPLTPSKEPPQAAVIPTALVGAWESTSDLSLVDASGAYTLPSGSVIFAINANGTGTAYNTYFKTADPCTWSVNGAKITLTIDYTSLGAGIMNCVYDWAIAANRLTLSNAVPATGSDALAGYVSFSPFAKGTGSVTPPPGIGDFTWIEAIPSEYIGTWAMDYEGTPFPIFVIAQGEGNSFAWSATQLTNLECTFKATADGKKLLLIIVGVGQCMYDSSIADNKLVLANGIADTSPSALPGYAGFGPFSKFVIP